VICERAYNHLEPNSEVRLRRPEGVTPNGYTICSLILLSAEVVLDGRSQRRKQNDSSG